MRTLLTTSSSFLLVALLAAACEPLAGGSSSSGGAGSPDPGPGTGTGTGTGTNPPVITCAPVTGPGTPHSGDVKPGEVWTAAGSPHIVEQNVTVRNGAKLTIEPCAEVRVAKGKHIQVAYPGTPNTGSLVAEGTASEPITFKGVDGGRWASLTVDAPGTARLAHVTFEGGGGGDFQRGATLFVTGDGEDGSDEIVSVDHVTIKGSLGAGAVLRRGAAFMKGSESLTIAGSGSDVDPYPLEIEEHAIDTLPTGSYAGNKKDEILLEPEGGGTAGSGLLADATLHERGVPYRIGRSKGQSFIIGGRSDGKLVTLTIEPGVKMRFTEQSGLKVQHFTSDDPSTGVLRALGTAAKPIVLTSASDTPAAGAWVGVWFGGVPSADNRLDHVRIEYAGGDCGCILNTCSNIAEHEGAVIFTSQPPSAFITNTVFANISGHGITEGYDGAFVDYRPTNTFEAVAGCVQTRPRNVDTSCPSPRPACD